jgi:hypothetical protein
VRASGLRSGTWSAPQEFPLNWGSKRATILFTVGDSEQSVNNLFPNTREHRPVVFRLSADDFKPLRDIRSAS